MSEPTAPAGDVAESVKDLRAMLRWTSSAWAAVGALLLGAGPLTALGRVDDRGDVAMVCGGVMLALSAVAWVIWQCGEALSPRLAVLGDYQDPDLAGLRAVAAREPGSLFGPFPPEPGALREARLLHHTAATNLAAMAAAEADEQQLKILEQGLRDARANAELAHRLERRLLELIHAWKLAQEVRRVRLRMSAAIVIVALGAALLLAAPLDDKKDANSKPPSAPSRAAVPADAATPGAHETRTG